MIESDRLDLIRQLISLSKDKRDSIFQKVIDGDNANVNEIIDTIVKNPRILVEMESLELSHEKQARRLFVQKLNDCFESSILSITLSVLINHPVELGLTLEENIVDEYEALTKSLMGENEIRTFLFTKILEVYGQHCEKILAVIRMVPFKEYLQIDNKHWYSTLIAYMVYTGQIIPYMERKEFEEKYIK